MGVGPGVGVGSGIEGTGLSPWLYVVVPIVFPCKAH